VALFAIDVQSQALPFDKNTSGVHNLTYLVPSGSVLRDLRKFNEVVRFSRVHVLLDRLAIDTIHGLNDYVKVGSRTLGIEIVVVPVDDSAQQALDSLPDDAEAVYLAPLFRLTDSEWQRLVAGLIERKLPSFSLLGRSEVERGVMASMRPEADELRTARRVGLNIQRILFGEDAATLPVTLDLQGGLVINMETADAVNVSPRWRVAIEAEQLNVEADRSDIETLTFSDAVREAVRENLTLRAIDGVVAAKERTIREAQSAYRPSVDIDALGLRIDRESSEASFGTQARRTLRGGVSLSQLIYSEDARAGIDISRHLQDALVFEREIERLDLAFDTARAFLDVLRAETLERIESDNLGLTTSNLELARRRERVGYSGPADVYRWESQIATDRSAVITARNQSSSARLLLNRLLNHPLEERLHYAAPTLDDRDLITGYKQLDPYVDTPASYQLFREFSVQEGLANSVELAALDATIAAQERAYVASRRSYWAPQVGFQAAYQRIFSRSAAGADNINPAFPQPRDSWSLAVSADFPVLTGGERRARTLRLGEELSALRVERAALAQQVELAARAALFDAASTYASIELAQEAAAASRRNLELVTESYSSGVVSVIELLDAQNSALLTEDFAANAVFDFLIDLMEIQRATNTFDFFASDDGRDAWFERLKTFFAQAGSELREVSR